MIILVIGGVSSFFAIGDGLRAFHNYRDFRRIPSNSPFNFLLDSNAGYCRNPHLISKCGDRGKVHGRRTS
jgi:hypothetical protein